MLNSILNNGEKISLMDGSVWQIKPDDVPTVCTWLPTADIKILKNNNDHVFSYILINKEIDISISAMKII